MGHWGTREAEEAPFIPLEDVVKAHMDSDPFFITSGELVLDSELDDDAPKPAERPGLLRRVLPV